MNFLRTNRAYDIVLMLITLSGVIMQLASSSSISNSLSYFTIQSNLLIVVCLAATLFFSRSKVGQFFSKTTVQSAITMYIIIVSLIYNFAIRTSWVQPFPQLIYDNILHVVTPLFFVIRWAVYIFNGTLKWKNGFVWLVYPLLYLFYSVVRGAIVGWYPYFFVNLNKISTGELVRNASLVLLVFLFISFLIIGVDKMLGKKKMC